MSEGVVVGRVGRPHGVRGTVRVEASGPTLPALELPADLDCVGPGDAPPRPVTVLARAGEPPRLRLDLAGVATREAAAALTGAVLRVAAARLPALADPDTAYVRDLLGCVVEAGGTRLGPVTEVHPAPANDVLEVAGADGPLLVPFTADAVEALDLPGRRIVVRADLLD